MSLRYSVAALALLLGLAIVATGLTVHPRATVVSCTQSGTATQSADASQSESVGQSGTASPTRTAQPTTPECTRTEQGGGVPWYFVGLGLAVAAVGGGIVAVDVALARYRPR